MTTTSTTTAALRARCAGCGQLRALRTDGRVRRHRDGNIACAGSNLLPAHEDQAEPAAESTGAVAEAEQILAAMDPLPGQLPAPARQLDQIIDGSDADEPPALYDQLVVQTGADPARIPTVADDLLAWRRVLEQAGVVADASVEAAVAVMVPTAAELTGELPAVGDADPDPEQAP